MSMKSLTILQFAIVFAVYIILTVLLPSVVFHRKVKGRHLTERFFLYFTTGNFYIMYLVFLLQLLRISNRWTLIACTVVPAMTVAIKINNISVLDTGMRIFQNIIRLFDGLIGRKVFRRKIGKWLVKNAKPLLLRLINHIRRNFADWFLFAGLTVLLLWLYGTNLLSTYGYCTSDIIVHNYWINYMGKNQIFVNGIYPFGFHCVIYYLRTVFGIDTYVLLRVFCLVQTLMIHYVLLAFLKACCRTRFAAYIGVGLYSAVSFFHINTYSRYYSSLPQEFGMLFILPAVWFAFRFFETKCEELEGQEKKVFSRWCLAGFAMSFCMTFAVHFYNTMIAGLFCIGIAIGFSFRLFRKNYFLNVLLTILISITVAVLPMGIGYVMGIPPESSLRWGMNVMSGEIPSDDTIDEDDGPGNYTGVTGIGKHILDSINSHILAEPDDWISKSILAGIGMLLLCGLVFLFFKPGDYGARLISLSLFMLLMSLLLAAGRIGIPALMDANRCSVYYAYMLPLVWGLCIDALLYLLLGRLRKKWIVHLTSFLCLALAGTGVAEAGLLKEPTVIDALQTNEAVTCLTNIIREHPKETWTICSANDELRMGEDHGYHYETIEFLRLMEDYDTGRELTLPTRYVYFFIEKVPIDYDIDFAYEGSGQAVSEKGAAMTLPDYTGLVIYKGKNRWIVMSRMYYWAKAFQEMYPNEMKVYYETDAFLCYRIEQNVYRPYNFAIDYGYNRRPEKAEKKE